MTKDDFANRVIGNLGGENASFLEDLLAFVKELLPVLIPLFGGCSGSRMRRSAERGRGVFYRTGMLRLNYTLSRHLGADDYAAYGNHLSAALVNAVAQSTDSELEQLLAA